MFNPKKKDMDWSFKLSFLYFFFSQINAGTEQYRDVKAKMACHSMSLCFK